MIAMDSSLTMLLESERETEPAKIGMGGRTVSVKMEMDEDNDFKIDENGLEELERDKYNTDEYDAWVDAIAVNMVKHNITMSALAAKISDKPEAVHNYYIHYKNMGPQQQKGTDEYTVACFRTTIVVDMLNKQCGIVTGCLLDTGASAHFINRKVVDGCGLVPTRLSIPKEFSAAKGIKVSYNEVVYANIWLGGLKKTITAYVDDSNDGTLFIIGYPAFQEFRLTLNVKGVDKQKETVLSVTPDIKYLRNIRYFVREDFGGPSKLRIVDRDSDAARFAKMTRLSEDVKAEKRKEAIKRRARKAGCKEFS